MIKRSEFYAFFIVMIVLFTASVSFAVSYQTSVIQPTKPVEAFFGQESAAVNTYYTALNVTGRGVLTRFSVFSAESNTNDQISFKITIDGVASECLGSAMSSYNSSYLKPIRGISPVSSTGTRSVVTDFIATVYFKSSLKIEIKTSNSGSPYLGFVAHYATE